MSITLQTATVASLDEVAEAVASWQQDGGPVQLHPGDLGWNWSMGAEALAGAVRVWRRDRQILAVGLVDDAGLIRMGIAPSVDRDDPFAAQLLADLSDPARGVLPAGNASVEARSGTAFRELLRQSGWVADEPWTPLRRDLTDKVEDCDLRVEVADAHTAPARVAVQQAVFPNSTFTLERWHTMAAASPYRRARCLVGYDAHEASVAVVTVWSAGRGRPGLLEPLGVHRDHRGHGYGTAISLAAAAALREMGASSATVCTPSSNVGAVAAYASAGFRKLPDVTDFRRTS
jgi:GNAT superfamily N-acetyltransferase